jgi:hypothetical protein
MKNAHYLHVCYTATYENKRYTNDSLVVLTPDKNMDWLREALLTNMETTFGIWLTKPPVITSLSEISEELFNILNQPTFEK